MQMGVPLSSSRHASLVFGITLLCRMLVHSCLHVLKEKCGVATNLSGKAEAALAKAGFKVDAQNLANWMTIKP